jgi:sugar/nucleoside kinase (ribokinase family)
LGGVSLDTIIELDDLSINSCDQSAFAKTSYTSIGGTGAGKAFTLKALDQPFEWVTVIGHDEAGQTIHNALRDREITYKTCHSDVSVKHTNIMYGKGNRFSIFTSMPKDDHIDIIDLSKNILDADVIFLNIDPFCKQFFEDIKQSQAKVIVDVHDYKPGESYHQPFIDLADILVGSAVKIHDDKAFLIEQINNKKECVIITKGSNGLVAMDQSKEMVYLSAYPIETHLDSNGAGDAFIAGFTTFYLRNHHFSDALLYGTVCGALSCTSYTLFPRDITKKQIEARFIEHKKDVLSKQFFKK